VGVIKNLIVEEAVLAAMAVGVAVFALRRRKNNNTVN
jgi:hypothetical protein